MAEIIRSAPNKVPEHQIKKIKSANASEINEDYFFVDGRIDQWEIEDNLPYTPLKIALFGKGILADTLLERLSGSTNHSVVAVIGPAKKEGDKNFDPVRIRAKELKIPDFKFEDMNRQDFSKVLKKYGADVFIGASLTAYMPNELAMMPKLGAWGLHPSKLLADNDSEGDFRGGDAIQWQIYNGEETIGLSIHAYGREDEQIVPNEIYKRKKPLPKGSSVNDDNDKADKGPVIAQSSIERGKVRTTSEIFPQKIVPKAVDLYIKTLNKMAVAKDQGLIFRGEMQIDGSGSYQPKMTIDNVRINWNDGGNTHVHKIEAGSFGQPAWSVDQNGDRIGMFDAEFIEAESDAPGNFRGLVVMESGKSYALLDAADGQIKIGRFRKYPNKGPRGIILEAQEFVSQENWEIGKTKLT